MAIYYARDFNWLKDFESYSGYSGLDIETEVIELSNGRTSGILPWDGSVACTQIEFSGDCWITHWDNDRDLANVEGSQYFVRYLTNQSIVKVIQNAVFEHMHLMHAFRDENPYRLPLCIEPVYDTMLAEYNLAQGRATTEQGGVFEVVQNDHPRQRLGLGDIVRRYFGHEMDKDKEIRTSFRRGASLTNRQVQYASEDAIYASRLVDLQLAQMDPEMRQVFELDCRDTEGVARMILRGIPVNGDRLRGLHTSWCEEMTGLEEALRVALYIPGDGEPILTPKTHKPVIKKGEVVVQRIKLNSDTEMPNRLRVLGYPVENYQAASLKKYQADPAIDGLIEWGQLETLTSRYSGKLPKFIHPVTGSIHCDYKTAVTMTGRAAVADPPLQQMPKRTARGLRIRGCFRALPGYKFVVADFGGIELRLIAEMFNEPTMIRAFREGIDLHSLTAAAIMFNVTEPSWPRLMEVYEIFEGLLKSGDKNAEKMRQDAKPVNFSLGYGGGSAKLQELAWRDYGIFWTLEEADQKRTMWRDLYSGVKRYHREESIRCNHSPEGRVVSSLDGRKRYVVGYSEGLNHPIQSTSAEMTKRAHIALTRQIPINLIIHDEFISHVPESEAEFTKEVMETAMIQAGQHYLKKVPTIVDVRITSAWKEVA